jgi:hypothetical protein
MSSVTRDWVQELPWKMQSVMLTSTRGPDNHRYGSVKILNRWIRGQLFHDADPANPFIAEGSDPDNLLERDFVAALQRELEYTTVHYYSHVLHTLEIIGYKHPEMEVWSVARELYSRLCHELHVIPESPSMLDNRLADVTVHV